MNEIDVLDLARNASGAGVWTLVLIAVVTLIKGWPALRKMSLEADGSMRKDLFTRIHELEEQLADERRECAAKIEELRDEILGLHRQMTTANLISGQALAPQLPPATAEAVLRQSRKDE